MTDTITPEEVAGLLARRSAAREDHRKYCTPSTWAAVHAVQCSIEDALEPMARLIATQAAEIERLRDAIRGLLEHSCIAEAHPEDKTADDWAAESAARAALEQEGG